MTLQEPILSHLPQFYVQKPTPHALFTLISESTLGSLEQDITYFNRTNDVQMKAEIKPGKTFGTTDLRLKVNEPANQQVVMFYDNAGRTDTGLNRIGLTTLIRSLFGYRDSLTFTAMQAAGTLAGSAAYSVPVTRRATRLGVSYAKNQINVVSGQFQTVDIQGDASDVSVSLKGPLIVEPKFNLDASLTVHVKESDTYFSGAKLIGTPVRTATLGFATQSTGDGGVLQTSESFIKGYVEGGHEFSKFSGSVLRQQLLSGQRRLTLRGALQLQGAGYPLVPYSEQFSLGGMSTVRGFEEGELIGDNGYFINIEMALPVSKKMEAIIFLDHGGVFPFKGNSEPEDHQDFLTSLGLGATIQFSKHLSVKTAFGLPVEMADWPGQLHFLLQSVF